MAEIWRQWQSVESAETVRASASLIANKLRHKSPKIESKLIDAALWWRVQFIRRMLTGEKGVGKRQLDFSDFSASSPDHVALWRTYRELKVDYPGFLELPAKQTPCGCYGSQNVMTPSSDFIKYVRERLEAYRSARQLAEKDLHRLIFDALAEAVEVTEQDATPDEGAVELDAKEMKAIERDARKVVVNAKEAIERNTGEAVGDLDELIPDNVKSARRMVRQIPDHVCFAVLAGQGFLHPDSRKIFRNDIFWTIPPPQAEEFWRKPYLDQVEMLRQWQREFLQTLHIYHGKKTPSSRPWHPGLVAWLCDNSPVFKKYGWRMEEVHCVVINKLGQFQPRKGYEVYDLPAKLDSFKKFCRRHDFKVELRSRSFRAVRIPEKLHADLLTPPPQLKLTAKGTVGRLK